MAEVTIESSDGLQQRVAARTHQWISDEPAGLGGDDGGPTPYEHLLGALGSCTSMTLLMYARRKGIPLEKVIVRLRDGRIHAADCTDCEKKEGFITEIDRQIELHGELTDGQRQDLMRIAAKCPVHRTLSAEIKVRDRLG